MFHVPENYRITSHKVLASNSSYGNNGAFKIDRGRTVLWLIASDGMDWESEMCFVKDIFWDDTDCVIQFHPPKSEYVNLHKFTLHLWKPINIEIPMPNSIMVGYKT